MNDLVLRPSYWANVSGGKDSLYMLKLILENPDKYALDGVVHFELENDFPFIKNVIDYMESECVERKIRFVRIQPKTTWKSLYNKYGYPTCVRRWCNSKYKLDAERQLKKFLKEQGCFLVSYIGLCADETRRFKYKETKDGIPLIIYPLVEYNIEESFILEWAKTQSIFNDYYKYNKRCGCMCCPLSSLETLAYTKKYYPNEYNYYMRLALETEERLIMKNVSISVWSSNPKYNTYYRNKKVDEILNGTYKKNKAEKGGKDFEMDEIIVMNEKFETVSKKLNKELDGIVTAFKNNEKAGEKLASHLYNINHNELWKLSDEEFVTIGDKECRKFGDVASVFGIGTQHAYKLSKAYELKYHEEVLTERLSSFKLGQIIEMIRVDVSDIIVLIDEEIVTPSMTLKQIRNAVDEYKKGDEDNVEEVDEEPSEDTEDGDEIDNTYKVVISGTEFIIEDEKVQKAISKVLNKYGIISFVEE